MNLQKVSPTEAQNRPFKQKARGQHYLLLLLANELHIPTPTFSKAPSTQRHKRQCPRVRGNPPVHLLRGINHVGLPSRWGLLRRALKNQLQFWGSQQPPAPCSNISFSPMFLQAHYGDVKSKLCRPHLR